MAGVCLYTWPTVAQEPADASLAETVHFASSPLLGRLSSPSKKHFKIFYFIRIENCGCFGDSYFTFYHCDWLV